MKHVILTIFLFCAFPSIAQEEKKTLIGTYYWVNSIPMKPCSIDGKEIHNLIEITSSTNQYFRVIRENTGDKKDYVVMEIINYAVESNDFYRYNVNNGLAVKSARTKEYEAMINDYNLKIKNYNDIVSSAADQKAREALIKPTQPAKQNLETYSPAYFTVSSDQILKNAAKYIPGGFTFGLINFPFKYRPQSGRGDFAGAFNFGAGLGLKFGHRETRETTFSFINGYSLSNINLDTPSVRRNSSDLEKTNNYSALSISLGLLLENQKVQAGLFCGMDILSNINQAQFGLYYQGKPWISIGFGYSLFSNEKPSNNPKSKQ